MFKNSKTSISNPNDASIKMRTRSATFATSTIMLMSFEHSKNVNRRFFPDTIVTGPWIFEIAWRVKFLTRHWSNVDLPTFGGPTIAMTMGGGSVGVRSTTGTLALFSPMSSLRLTRFSVFWTFWIANALGFFCRAESSLFESSGPAFPALSFFLSAFLPECALLWAFFFSSPKPSSILMFDLGTFALNFSRDFIILNSKQKQCFFVVVLLLLMYIKNWLHRFLQYNKGGENVVVHPTPV